MGDDDLNGSNDFQPDERPGNVKEPVNDQQSCGANQRIVEVSDKF